MHRGHAGGLAAETAVFERGRRLPAANEGEAAMAFLNFSELQGSPIAVPADVVDASGFTGLEWSVIALAQNDRLSTLSRPSRMSVALGVVFGGERPNPKLADARLEALRRMAVLSWHRGYSVAASELEAFHAAGFSPAQYETLLESISRGRTARNRRN
jgi:hypothetical protein